MATARLGEEIVFHGHLQTRFEVAWGTGVGYALTVLVPTFARFPGGHLQESGNVVSAMPSALGRVRPLRGFF